MICKVRKYMHLTQEKRHPETMCTIRRAYLMQKTRITLDFAWPALYIRY